ncbi:hypothetical protein, partial [Paramuribaculum intestinale]|uniref:hypothetical protein n=1 Tax=Paramuribaculum intestinale TaxID=2094151 RepID=UPI0025B64AD0
HIALAHYFTPPIHPTASLISDNSDYCALPPPLPDGLALSEPRSVRADSIPGSERHDAPRPRVSEAWERAA